MFFVVLRVRAMQKVLQSFACCLVLMRQDRDRDQRNAGTSKSASGKQGSSKQVYRVEAVSSPEESTRTVKFAPQKAHYDRSWEKILGKFSERVVGSGQLEIAPTAQRATDAVRVQG